MRDLLVSDRGLSLHRARQLYAHFLPAASASLLNYYKADDVVATFIAATQGGSDMTLRDRARRLGADLIEWGRTRVFPEYHDKFFDYLWGCPGTTFHRGSSLHMAMVRRRLLWDEHRMAADARVVSALHHMLTLPMLERTDHDHPMAGETCAVCGRGFCVDNDDGIGPEIPVAHIACPLRPGTAAPGQMPLPLHPIGRRCYLRIAASADPPVRAQCPYCRRDFRPSGPSIANANQGKPHQDAREYMDD